MPAKSLKPMDDIETRFYFRLWAADRPGVLAKIAAICGTHSISIASVIQKEADPVNKLPNSCLRPTTRMSGPCRWPCKTSRGWTWSHA